MRFESGPYKGRSGYISFRLISSKPYDPPSTKLDFQRRAELDNTIRNRKEMKARNRLRAEGELADMAIMEAQQRAEQRVIQNKIIGRTVPDYQSVTVDSRGRISIYRHFPNGVSTFNTSSGYSSTTVTTPSQ